LQFELLFPAASNPGKTPHEPCHARRFALGRRFACVTAFAGGEAGLVRPP